MTGKGTLATHCMTSTLCWYPLGRRVPAQTRITRKPMSGGTLVGGTKKVVHHKTQVESENADALYRKTGFWPHFTVGPNGTQQHLPLNVASYGLKNLKGGLETNRGGTIVAQIEVVGHSGVNMPDATRAHLLGVLRWLRDEWGIPYEWPSGRPAPTAYGPHNRNADNWRFRDGQFAHSQVPENTHWDPAYTDAEWWLLARDFEKYQGGKG